MRPKEVGRDSRDRVTVDLRGMGGWLQTCAAARKMTTAALVRKALLAELDDERVENDTSSNGAARPSGGQLVKITLRVSAAHAVALATRARAADVSQGRYVASLIDGSPVSPLPPDHADAVAALLGSTDQLAILGADINAFMRLLGRGSSGEIEQYRAGIMSLAEDVRRHLAVAALLLAQVRAARQLHAGDPSSTRSDRKPR